VFQASQISCINALSGSRLPVALGLAGFCACAKARQVLSKVTRRRESGRRMGVLQEKLSFNPSLKVDFRGSRVTSDGGLILVRELDERLGSGELIEQHLTDSRRGKNTQFPFADLLRQSIYSRLAGHEDLNDAPRLSQDPTFRLSSSGW
jgi:hypothetical protein